MILDHVEKSANSVVEAPTVLNVESFGHGDLDAANIVAVPERLEHRIGKPRVEDVLNRLLAQIMVDAKDRLFGEVLQQCAVERLRRFAIAAERFFNDEAGVDVETALSERGNDNAKKARGDRQIVQRPLGAAERLLQLRKGLRIVVIAVDIPQKSQELIKLRRVGAPVLLDAVLGSLPQLFDCPARLGDADDRHIDAFIVDEAQKRRKDLLEREIAGRAKKHQSIGLGGLHLTSCGIPIGSSVDRR